MRASLRAREIGLLLLGVAAACSSARGPVPVALAPTLIAPEDVLTNAATVGVVVYEANTGVTCDAATGRTKGATAATAQVASTQLAKCPAGSAGVFCGSLTLEESASARVFGATALSTTQTPLAYGCSQATVNQAKVSLSITMLRNLPAAVCGNGEIEPTEQCDPPPGAGMTDAVCDASCHSQEEPLSTGATSPQGPAALVWPVQTGTSGELFAFFVDDVGAALSPPQDHPNIALRAMSDALEPVSNPVALGQAILAPNDPTTFPPAATAGNQTQPAATFVAGTYFYAFTDTASGDPDVHLRSFDGTSLAGDQPAASPIVIDGTPGTQQDSPALAVNGTGTLFIAWRDLGAAGVPSAGQIFGRTYAPTGGTLGTTNLISVGSGNENVRVAGTAGGWVAVWDDGTQIKMRPISGNGTPAGPEIVVSDASHKGIQDSPGVAALSDGRVAITWADHGTARATDIFVQRYDANLEAVSGDQATAINDVVTSGDQITPAIAGTAAAGGSFVAAWLDSSSGHVRGRIVDGSSGFDFNPVDGTTSEFQVSLAAGKVRENPAVAVGGSQSWIAFAWDVKGVVFARRFPTSTQAQ